jgi:hypothetical protein
MEEEKRQAHDRLEARLRTLGEPFRTHLQTQPLHVHLRDIGFSEIEDLGPRSIRSRYFNVDGGSSDQGGHVILATAPSRH